MNRTKALASLICIILLTVLLLVPEPITLAISSSSLKKRADVSIITGAEWDAVIDHLRDQRKTASYIIYKDGSTIKALNGTTGAVDYSGTNVSQITNSLSGKIVFKDGFYLFDTPLVPKANSHIIGESRFGTILRATSAIQGIIQVNTNNVTIENLSLDLNSIAEHGIRTSYTTAVSNIFIQGLFLSGAKLNAAYITYFDVDKGYIKNNWIEDANLGVGIVASYGVKDVEISGNYLLNVRDNAIETIGPHLTAYPERVNIHDNIIRGGNGRGIVTGENASYIKIHNNLISNKGSRGIDVETTVAGRLAQYIDIRDNKIWNTSYAGIRIVESAGSFIENITIVDNEILSTPSNEATILITGTITDLKVKSNIGYVTENTATFTSINNGTWVSHGLAGTPQTVIVSLTTQGYAWIGSTNSTKVQLYFNTATASGSFYAEYKP